MTGQKFVLPNDFCLRGVSMQRREERRKLEETRRKQEEEDLKRKREASEV